MLTISRFWQALQCAPKSNHGSFNRTLNTAGFKPWLSDSKSNRADESNSGELNNHTAHSHAALHHYARVPEDSALRRADAFFRVRVPWFDAHTVCSEHLFCSTVEVKTVRISTAALPPASFLYR